MTDAASKRAERDRRIEELGTALLRARTAFVSNDFEQKQLTKMARRFEDLMMHRYGTTG